MSIKRTTPVVAALVTLGMVSPAEAGIKMQYSRAYYSTKAACGKTPGTNIRREGVPPDGREATTRHYRAAIKRLARKRDQCRPWTYVLASWYGPGLYGNPLACGGRLYPGIRGVANKTLPCGTRLELRHGSRRVVTQVIDRGPYVGGRTFDLTAATRADLGCPSLCTVGYR